MTVANYESPGEAAEATCQLRISATGHPVVEVEIAGQTVTAVVDLAATTSVIDSGLASKLHLVPSGLSIVLGVTGNSTTRMLQAPSIRLCGRDLGFDSVLSGDFATLTGDQGSPVKMVLGQDFLARSIVRLDFPRGRLSVLDDEDLSAGRCANLQRTKTGLYAVPILVEGAAALAVLDTGSAVPLYISPGLFFRLDSHGRRMSTTASLGVEGLSVAKAFTVSQVVFADAALRDVPAQSPDHWTSEADVILGAPLLRRFAIDLDLRKGRACFFSAPNDLSAAFPRDRSGMNVLKTTTALQVVYVAPGGPASRAGLAVGDRIVAVDGQPVGPALFTARPRMGAEPSGTRQELTLSGGRTVELVLQDYF